MIIIHNVNVFVLLKESLNGERKKKLAEKAAAEEKRRELLEDIERCTRQLEKVRQKYDLVCEDELIEALIYEEKALFARYAYLMRVARENGIKYKVVIPR